MFKASPRFYVNARAIIERQQEGRHEVLLQVRNKVGEARALEFPGGQLNLFEGILDALRREIREETGLEIKTFLDQNNASRHTTAKTEVECLTPSFVYQTCRGPVDSVGFFFRVEAKGKIADTGDGAIGHRWITLAALRDEMNTSPATFNWLTLSAIQHLFQNAWKTL